MDDAHRIYHSHGNSLKDMFELKFGHIERCVDVVVYPTSHE